MCLTSTLLNEGTAQFTTLNVILRILDKGADNEVIHYVLFSILLLLFVSQIQVIHGRVTVCNFCLVCSQTTL